MICDLLDALQKQDLEKKYYETIVVCDYDPKALKGRYKQVRWFFLDDKSISAKRNLGVFVSRGEVVAFTDDDCKPCENWISEGLDYLQRHENSSAVEGHTIIEKNSCGLGMYKEAKRLEKPAMRTNNIFYRKKVFLEAGGFDQRFSVQREDADLAFSVLEKGGSIQYCPRIRVLHRFRHWEQWDLLKNCWNRRFDPLLYLKHPQLYRKYIGSPITPSVSLQFFAYVVYAFARFFSVSKKQLALFHFFLTGILALRRSGLSNLFHTRFVVEFISVLVSPFVVMAALVYGFICLGKIKQS
ncbi:MAG: glycosyltransferase [Fibrobacter sp.]|nr:glycosyltransferase [Fibrobacter sp.]